MDAQYAVPTGAADMGSTLTTGHSLVAPGVRANFVRVKVISVTGRSRVSVQILGEYAVRN